MSSSGGSSSGGSGGGSSGSSSSSSGGVPDDAADDSGFDAAMADVVEAAAPTQLVCKDATQSTTCDHGQICCVATGFTGTTATCQSGGGCTGTTIHCAGTADCPASQVCCAVGTTTGVTTTYSDVSCTQSCPPATGAFQARYQVCDPSGNDCPSGKTCTASTAIIGYSVCR